MYKNMHVSLTCLEYVYVLWQCFSCSASLMSYVLCLCFKYSGFWIHGFKENEELWILIVPPNNGCMALIYVGGKDCCLTVTFSQETQEALASPVLFILSSSTN